MEEAVSRREIFYQLAKVGKGVVAGLVLYPTAIAAYRLTDLVPGVEGGNASYKEYLRDRCKAENPEDPAQCDTLREYDYEPTATDFRDGVVIAPVFEEGLFRLLPSRGFDKVWGKHQDDRPDQSLGLTRAEWIAGGITSILFGYLHNFDASNKFYPRTIPTPQILVGLGLWKLQREEGIVANTVAHATLNGVSLGLNKAF